MTELHNSFFSLSDEEKASLHATLEPVKSCHNAKSCQAAERRFVLWRKHDVDRTN